MEFWRSVPGAKVVIGWVILWYEECLSRGVLDQIRGGLGCSYFVWLWVVILMVIWTSISVRMGVMDFWFEEGWVASFRFASGLGLLGSFLFFLITQ